MKYLCLAYGDESGWNSLSEEEQRDALAHDAVIRDRGNFVTAVRPKVTSVKNWDSNLEVSEQDESHRDRLPLAGFSIIEADSMEHVIKLVANTPCARARGVIEIREFWNTDD